MDQSSMMMTCQEARELVYDIQTMRIESNAEADKRGSLFALAQAHLLVCIKCNGFFEHERAFVHALHDRIVHAYQPMPATLLSDTLQRIHLARVEEAQPRFSRGFVRGMSAFIKSLFSRSTRF
jgi:hypothetical protein